MGRLRWQRPWMLKLPLFNPNPFLSWLYVKTRFIWTRAALWVWSATVLSAALVLVDYLPHLQEFWSTRFLDPINLLLLVIIYPLLKACHELAHGLTTKKWGGEVYEVGLMFLVFMPVPYVDASASSQFSDKYQRMLVAASGVMTELFLAALALFVWIGSENILIRDICLNIMIIGVLSSLLFNGNPLLRFDGYYVFSDWLEIPNLASRSTQYLSCLWHKFLLGVVEKPLRLAQGEKKWLLSYAVLSGIYRIFISVGVAIYIAGHYFFIGVLLAIWAVYLQLIAPSVKGLRNSFLLAREQRRRTRWLGGYGLMVIALFLLLFVVPVRHTTQAPGLLRVAGQYQIKTAAEGFLQEILVKNGEAVTAGQALLVLHNPSLASEIAGVVAQIAEVEVLLNRALMHEPTQAGFYRDELIRLRRQLADLEGDRANLTVTSHAAGVIEMAGLDNLLGRYFLQGDTLGYVLASGAGRVVAVVPEQTGDWLATPVQETWVKLRAQPRQKWLAGNVRPVPLASHQLPDAYLGSLFGGPVSVDTSMAEGIRALAPVFQVEMDIPLAPSAQPLTGRVEVLFVHAKQPLGVRLLQKLRLELLQRFNW